MNFVNKFSKTYEVTYGDKPTLRSIYIKAAAHALKRVKKLNVKILNDERVDNEEIEINVGIRHLKVTNSILIGFFLSNITAVKILMKHI